MVTKYEKVPKKWWNQRNQTNTAIQTLATELQAHPAVTHIQKTPIKSAIDGHRYFKIQVGVDSSIDEIELPNRVHNVRVERIPSGSFETTVTYNACYNDGEYDPISGGEVLCNKTDGYFTSACRVKKNGSGSYMLTAAHPFYDENSSSCSGALNEPCWQGESTTSNRKFGEVYDWYSRHDWAILTVGENGLDADRNIRFPNGNKYVVKGHYTKEKIDRMASYGNTVHKIGASTGNTTGEIKSISYKINNGHCIYMDGAAVRVSNNQAGGDSGGPVFELVGDKCEMVSIATLGNTSEIIGTACGGNTLYSHAYGWPAYKLANIANIQFYTGP